MKIKEGMFTVDIDTVSLEDRLKRVCPANSGNLRNSLKVKVLKKLGKISVKCVGLSYLPYVVKGRKPGKYPPFNDILRWVNSKGLKGNPKSLAFLISRKIANKGTKGVKIDDVINKTKIKVKVNGKLKF